MRHLLVLLACGVCMTAWSAPRAPQLTQVFGQARAKQHDMVVLRTGERLTGRLAEAEIRLVTPYGQVALPLRRLAGLQVAAQPGAPDIAVTVNGNRLSGILLDRSVRLRREGFPTDLELRLETATHLLTRLDRQEAAFFDPKAVLLLLDNGDQLTGTLAETGLNLALPQGRQVLPLTDLRDAAFTLAGPDLRAQATRRNGATLAGTVLNDTFSLRLDAGPTLAGIWRDRLARLIVVDAYPQLWAMLNLPPPPPPVDPPVITGDKAIVTLPGPDKVKVELKRIHPGQFTMGGPKSEKNRGDDEDPLRQVRLTKPFFLGIHEVTQAQWAAVMGESGGRFAGKPQHPVDSVTWEDCQRFLAQLNALEIGTFRLPTEAEWEYACRAGTTTEFSYGDDPGYDRLGDYAWYEKNAKDKTQAVGQKQPNPWGLYDMHGNVYEWCQDWYGKYRADQVNDPQGPATGTEKVRRGGSFNRTARYSRTANRSKQLPAEALSGTGLRLVFEPALGAP